MESYKRGSHTVWDCKYHLVWVTKYRYAVLGGDVGQRCRELLREVPTSCWPSLQLAQTLLGPAPVGTGLLGRKQWQRDR
jgi:hypothetical protein